MPPLKAQSGQTGKGDAAPLILPAQEVGPLSAKGGPHGTGGIGDQEVHQGHVIDPSLGQDETVPFAPGDNGWRGDPAQETYVRDGATQSLTSRFGSSGTDYPDAEAGWLVAGQEPDPTGGQELAATLKGQRGKGGGGIGPEETLLPVDEATGFYSTESQSSGNNENISPTLKVGSGAGIPSPPAVFSKRHAASDADDSETWDESEQAHTLNQNMNAPDVAADAQAVRRLTPTEAERLQGLPDSWTLPYGPSLADAPAWHDLRTPPSPLRAVTINEGNDTPQGSVWESDQCGSLATGGGKPGQGYHAVRTEADPTWIGLDNANRGNDHVKEGQQNSEALRAKGTLDQAIGYTVHGENSTAMQGGGDAAVAFETDAARSLDRSGGYATNQGGNVVGFYPNQGSDSNSSGAREGEAPTLSGGGGGNTPAVAYSLHSDAMGRDGAAKADSPDAEGRMRKRDAGMGIAEGESYSLTAGQAHGVAYDATSPPLTAAGFHGNADGSDDQVEATALAFEARYYSDRERMGGAPSGEAGPVKATDSKAGDAAQVVAFAQNQRDEVRELDDASSLSGQGTHQTTYVAGAIAAVAEGTARPFDCPPDGSRYAALGDAVTAPVVRWQAERLVDVLRERGVIKPDGSVDLTADLDENLQPLFPITPAK